MIGASKKQQRGSWGWSAPNPPTQLPTPPGSAQQSQNLRCSAVTDVLPANTSLHHSNMTVEPLSAAQTPAPGPTGTHVSPAWDTLKPSRILKHRTCPSWTSWDAPGPTLSY